MMVTGMAAWQVRQRALPGATGLARQRKQVLLLCRDASIGNCLKGLGLANLPGLLFHGSELIRQRLH
jgi:hypothetical protein